MKALQAMPFFLDLDINMIRDLAKSAVLRSSENGDIVCRKGEVADRLYILAVGRCEVEVDGNIVTTLESPSYFGEMALVVEGKTRDATVRCASRCAIYEIIEQDFHRTVGSSPEALEDVKQRALDHVKHRKQNLEKQTRVLSDALKSIPFMLNVDATSLADLVQVNFLSAHDPLRLTQAPCARRPARCSPSQVRRYVGVVKLGIACLSSWLELAR